MTSLLTAARKLEEQLRADDLHPHLARSIEIAVDDALGEVARQQGGIAHSTGREAREGAILSGRSTIQLALRSINIPIADTIRDLCATVARLTEDRDSHADIGSALRVERDAALSKVAALEHAVAADGDRLSIASRRMVDTVMGERDALRDKVRSLTGKLEAAQTIEVASQRTIASGNEAFRALRDEWAKERDRLVGERDTALARVRELEAEVARWRSPCGTPTIDPIGPVWICPTCHDPKCGDL